MTEQEYLSRLERALKDAPEDDRNEALAFYHGYFEDGGIPTTLPKKQPIAYSMTESPPFREKSKPLSAGS